MEDTTLEVGNQTPLTVSELVLRVKRGAQLLDEKVPGWTEKIDLETLKLSSSYSCVLGQVFGDYSEGVNALSGIPYGITSETVVSKRLRFAQQHGFESSGDIGYSELDEAWEEYLSSRIDPLGTDVV